MLKSAYQHLIFDFDGVLVESNEIRFEGFRLLFKDFPDDKVEKLVQYARLNGGMSRYKKISYFFENLLNKPVTWNEVKTLSGKYSEIVKEKIINCECVEGSLEFLSANKNKYDFAVVSGSDQEELRQVCKAREIDHFFVKILGSPVNKDTNVMNLLSDMGWEKRYTLLIGDSFNDYEAAKANNIDFLARNSGLGDWNSMGEITVINELSQLQNLLT